MAIGTALAIAGAGLVGSAISANAQSNAAEDAAEAQTQAAEMGIDAQLQATQLGIDEQRYQFDEMRNILGPYADAGQSALMGQLDILGANGDAAQQGIINNIENSSHFQSMVDQGENAMLQNASATGGLRGGNTQAALAQFRPNMLSQLIDQQYNRLGGITSLGQNAAAGVGNAGMQTGANIANLTQQSGAAQSGLLQQMGAAQAGNAIAQGNAIQSGIGGITNAFSTYQGIKSGGF